MNDRNSIVYLRVFDTLPIEVGEEEYLWEEEEGNLQMNYYCLSAVLNE